MTDLFAAPISPRKNVETIKATFFKCQDVASVNACAVHYKEEVVRLGKSKDQYERDMSKQIRNLAGYLRAGFIHKLKN